MEDSQGGGSICTCREAQKKTLQQIEKQKIKISDIIRGKVLHVCVRLHARSSQPQPTS